MPSARATPWHLAGLAGRPLGLTGAPAGGALGRLADLADGVGRAGLRHVVGALAVELGAGHRVGQARDLPQETVEHLLLVSEYRVGQPLGLAVARDPREPGQGGVGGDLLRLGGARVLGVLEHLLLAAAAANEVDRRLGQRQPLPDHRLDQAETDLERVVALPELAQATLDALGVPASLAEVGLEPVAVLAARGHGDLGLKLAHQRKLRAVGLVQVLHDLLLLLLTHECSLIRKLVGPACRPDELRRAARR